MNRLVSMIRNLMKRSVVTLPYVEEPGAPRQQISYEGKTVITEILFPYGMFASLPVDKVLGITFAVGGDDDDLVSMFYPPLLRPDDLEEGEVVIYHPITGSKVFFRNSGDIDVESDTTVNVTATTVNVTAPTINLTGDVTIDGSLVVTETSTADDHISDGISGKTHTHGGVQTGGGSTGVPQ